MIVIQDLVDFNDRHDGMHMGHVGSEKARAGIIPRQRENAFGEKEFPVLLW